ncbi:MAG: hypothetical protein IPK87_05920 [Planctomycetes bacterium]|nr:hypothetical protein [Planctomycetota bacterium]
MEEQTATQHLVSRARRVQWACGLCFGLLFLMGISGIASITLLYDDPLYHESTRDIEGATLRTAIELKWLIGALHMWGGYVAILLAGWAAMEVFSFSRLVRRSDNPGWRSTARWLGPAGIGGGATIVLAVVLLLASGVAAKGYVQHITRYGEVKSEIEGAPGEHDAAKALEGYPDSNMAEWHIREMNYLLAIGAIVLVAAAASVRRISIEARKPKA